jgi:hypothetical protein
LVLSPAMATITAGGSQAYTAEGFDAFGNDVGDFTGTTSFTVSPNGSCTGATCTATVAGAHTVTGTNGLATGTASLTVNPAALDHLVLSPATATFTAGGSQAYAAQGRDQYNNSHGQVTASTPFTIAPDGSCTGASCTASTAGAHTVTGTQDGKTVTANLQVNAGTLDHITISPANTTITAGGSQAYTAQGFDQYHNSKGNVTEATVFSISPNGSCTGPTCTATVAGVHTVSGNDSGKMATASLQVNAGALDHISISPASATITAGGSQAYTAQGFDQYNNSLGDVTSVTNYSISPNGSCTGPTCTATVAGAHTVTGNDSGKTATASLQVNPVTFTFAGFFAPVDNPSMVNTANAGQAIPVKWELTLNGVPVSDPSSFLNLTSYSVTCGTFVGNPTDIIEEYAAGSSGLQYLGSGNWQFNWKTPKNYANTCRVMVLTLSDNSTHIADFKFK